MCIKGFVGNHFVSVCWVIAGLHFCLSLYTLQATLLLDVQMWVEWTAGGTVTLRCSRLNHCRGIRPQQRPSMWTLRTCTRTPAVMQRWCVVSGSKDLSRAFHRHLTQKRTSLSASVSATEMRSGSSRPSRHLCLIAAWFVKINVCLLNVPSLKAICHEWFFGMFTSWQSTEFSKSGFSYRLPHGGFSVDGLSLVLKWRVYGEPHVVESFKATGSLVCRATIKKNAC